MEENLEPLWKHQIECLEKIELAEGKKIRGFALFMSPGVGKTRIVIERLRELFKRKKNIRRTLIVCPPVVVKQWKGEFARYSKIDQDRIVLLRGSGRQRLDTFLREIDNGINPNASQKIFITNYESLLMEELFAAFVAWGPEVMILDESHRIKNYGAKRTKAAIRLGKLAVYKFIMTGSPILNSITDIFSQTQFLNSEVFGTNPIAFRRVYMTDKNAGMPRYKYFPNWVPKPGAEEAIQFKIKPFSFHARKEDCLTLPPFVKQRVEIEMGPDQEKAYRQMEKEFITFVAGNPVVAELAITKSLRMRQILSGFARDAEGRDWPFKDNPRLDALEDLLEDLIRSEKVIIWTDFQYNYNMIAAMIQNRLKETYRCLTGEQSQTEKERNIQDFQHDPFVKIMIANPGAGGVGVNLTAASSMIYYSRSCALEHDIQSEARAYRGGSEIHKSITRFDLVIPNTLDDVILDALSKKMKVGDAIVGWAAETKTRKVSPEARSENPV